MAQIPRPGAASRHPGSIRPVRLGHKFAYPHDFGDNWRHIVKVKAIEAWAERMYSATILGGRPWWPCSLPRHNL